MSVILEIEGNTVRQVQRETLKTVSLESFVASIESNVPVESGMLPRNCIYFCKRGGRFVYVIEVLAQLVNVRTRNREGQEHQYRIHIPFTQFYVTGNPVTKAIGNIYLTATKRPLRSLSEPVFTAPYPNIHSNGRDRLCTGSMNVPAELELEAKVNVICSEFFTAAFNNDLTPGCPDGWTWNRGVDAYMQHWADLSSQNRCLMLSDSVAMRQHPSTPAQIIETCFRGVDN